MPVYERGGRRVLFVHVPKTGGTSIEAAFRRAGFEESYRSKTLTARGCRPQHLTAADLVEEFPGLPFDYVFAVVRDPGARLGSERVWRAGHLAKKDMPVPDFESFATTWLDRYDADPTAAFIASMAHHFHNAAMPDSGFSGEVLLGPALDAVIERARETAMAELSLSVAAEVRAALAPIGGDVEPHARAFHVGDVLDRVLEIEQHLRAATVTMDDVLVTYGLVHDGPVKGFHDRILGEVGLA